MAHIVRSVFSTSTSITYKGRIRVFQADSFLDIMACVLTILGAVAILFTGFALATPEDGARYTHTGEYIVGGSDAAIGEYPWQIMLKQNGDFACGGTIITRRHILTAAHCIYADHNTYKVLAGELDLTTVSGAEQAIRTSRIFVHPRYSESTLKHDIAIVKLRSKLNYTASVQRVRLSNGVFDQYALTSTNCWATGFGVSSQNPDAIPTILQEMNTNIITNGECNNRLAFWEYFVYNKNVCVKDNQKSTCFGDSGGPLGCYDNNNVFRQVGITSWGPSRTCIRGPGVFTRVSKYRTWIRNQIAR